MTMETWRPGRLRRAVIAVAAAFLLAAPAARAQAPHGGHEVHHIHGLAVDRRDPEVLYVATHTGLVRVKPDAPAEWVGAQRFDLMGFTAHPGEAGVVYASGHPDLATYRRDGLGNLGLLMSRDGGERWQSVALKGEADFHALTYSPRDGGQLFGWSVAGRRGLHRIALGSFTVERLPARGLAKVLSLSAGPDPAGPLVAGTETGLMLSRDGGLSWTPVTSVAAGAPVTAVSHHATDGRRLYAYALGPELGLLQSRDGGVTWERTGWAAAGEAYAVALAAGPGEHVVVATSGSDLVRARDGGRTWRMVLERGRPASGR